MMFAYAVSMLIGYALLAAWVDRGRKENWLLVFAAPGVGLAVTASLLFYLTVLTGHIDGRSAFLAHAIVLTALGAWYCMKPNAGLKRSFPHKSAFVFLAVLTAALVSSGFIKSPYGVGIDAWAIWKIKARFLYLSQHWPDVFSPVLHFSHPDYPLLYPLASAWGWLGAGHEGLLAPILVCGLFTVSITGLMAAAFEGDRWKTGMAAALWMASIPFFTGIGGSLYADIIVAYYNLAAVILLDRALESRQVRLAFAAGFMAASCLFVKNEGWLFCTVFAAVLALLRRKESLAALLGMMPMLALTLLFKQIASTPSHILSLDAARQHVLTPELGGRLALIAHYFTIEVFKENAWVYAWFLAGLALVLYPKRWLERRAWILYLALFVAAGYIGIYLITTIPLERHLKNSIDRILMHFFPILLYFVMSGEPFTDKRRA